MLGEQRLSKLAQHSLPASSSQEGQIYEDFGRTQLYVALLSHTELFLRPQAQVPKC